MKKRGLEKLPVILFALGVFVLFITISFAAYTRQSFQKGVVSTTRGPIQFSSDLLHLYGNDENDLSSKADVQTTIDFYGKELQDCATTFHVYNYPLGLPAQHNQKDINYRISFSIQAVTGTIGIDDYQNFNIFYEDTPLSVNQQGQYIHEEILNGLSADAHTYKIVYPLEMLNNIMVDVRVEPLGTEDKVATGNQCLYRRINPVSNKPVETKEFTCSGEFVDAATGKSTEYHAFNYEILVQNGKGKASLTWNASKLKIDDAFIRKANGDYEQKGTTETDYKTFTWDVDSDQQSNYSVVFYRTANSIAGADSLENDGGNVSEESNHEDWDMVKKLVTFSVKEENSGN